MGDLEWIKFFTIDFNGINCFLIWTFIIGTAHMNHLSLNLKVPLYQCLHHTREVTVLLHPSSLQTAVLLFWLRRPGSPVTLPLCAVPWAITRTSSNYISKNKVSDLGLASRGSTTLPSTRSIQVLRSDGTRTALPHFCIHGKVLDTHFTTLLSPWV